MKALIVVFSMWAVVSAAADCTSQWERFSSKPYQGVLFPDLDANYWRYRFEVPTGARIALRLDGRYAHARYMNYNVYDQATLDSAGSLPDREIPPREGSVNPFREGVRRDAAHRDYTAWVVPAGEGTGRPGALEMPKPQGGAKTQAIELWYRVFVADPGTDELGGTGLPKITAIDLATGREAACPPRKTSLVPVLTALGNRPPGPDAGAVRFYASRGASLYPNKDNQYLVGELGFQDGNVAVIRVRPPSWFDSRDPRGVFRGGTEVRFWSLCIVGIFTQTSSCLSDKDTAVGKDGFVTLVIGPARIEKEVRAKGLGFMPRGGLVKPYLLYRHMLTRPGFAGDFSRIPPWPQPAGSTYHTAEQLVATRFIGDFAPSGRHCDAERFLVELGAAKETLCGVKADYP